jgi:hypothetical protein
LNINGDKPVSTLYPVVFASNDFKQWRVVADADDVPDGSTNRKEEESSTTHLSASLLVANLKSFGCTQEDERVQTDPFMTHFSSKLEANQFKWKLVEHVALHGTVNLIACVMQGMDEVNELVDHYSQKCIIAGSGISSEMKCHMTSTDALKQCFALGSACGQSCNYFAPYSPECMADGTLSEALFQGLTPRKVKIKTAPGGGGAAEALVYCSKKGCKSGLHYENMYVEAVNPVDFLKAQADSRNKEKGSFYVLMFAMSDYHQPMHTFVLPSHNAKGEHGHHSHHVHMSHHHSVKEPSHHHPAPAPHFPAPAPIPVGHHHVPAHEQHEKDEHHGPAPKHGHTTTKKPPPKTKEELEKEKKAKEAQRQKEAQARLQENKDKHERVCVDLPGVRLNSVEHSAIGKPMIGAADASTPRECTAQCGMQPTCKQAIFAHSNKGCYLQRNSTVEVTEFSPLYNSSYCGDKQDEELMLTMIHAANRAYVPKKGVPEGPLKARRLQASNTKLYYWQIAHVPNLTIGVLRDQGADSMRVVPRNGSCFSAPGFTYMVACMTAKPVYMSGRHAKLAPPPFNDRCIAVGSACGAACGSGSEDDDEKTKVCIPKKDGLPSEQASPYASGQINWPEIVQHIEPSRSATQPCMLSRIFFHLFIFFIGLSYMSIILSKFPGNFTDFYPVHTWDEIRTHGYVLEKFGAAVAAGCSAGESKMVVLRNWIGKIASRPQFDDQAFPTFSKWVDVFCDEGHREGARILWVAWTDFLNTNPPLEFLEKWAQNVLNVTWDQSLVRSPFDLKWQDAGSVRKVLPVTADQAEKFMKSQGEEVPEGGVELQQDTLAKLQTLYEVYNTLPDSMRMEPSLPNQDDCILVRKVGLGLEACDEEEMGSTFLLKAASQVQRSLDAKAEERVKKLGLTSTQEYKDALTVTDKNGKTVKLADASSLADHHYPLHCREPLPRLDRQVIMIYCARAKPEGDNRLVEKTRCLDNLLYACLTPQALYRGESRKTAKLKARNLGGMQNHPALKDIYKSVNAVLERQNERHLASLSDKDAASQGHTANTRALQREFTLEYMKHRKVGSDWELSRFCYGEIVGADRDPNGDEVLILDNPSPALVELVNNPGKNGNPGMGLAAREWVDEKQCFGGNKKVSRTTYAKPSLEFVFLPNTPLPKDYKQQLLKKLSQVSGITNQEMTAHSMNGLQVTDKQRDEDLIVEVQGPGKVIEAIRESNPSSIQIGTHHGRLMDCHVTVMVKKDLLMPFCGVRGKSGGLNFAVDLLQFRDGYIGTGEDGDPVPEHMLYGIFDARHMPHPDFWRKCLPKFMNNKDLGYTYEVNDQVCMVQAPQSFASVKLDDDILDVTNGMCFNVMNVIRNRCGGVTSCGTNAIWHINGKDFSRLDDASVTNEYFDSRTKIEDTASTHVNFCKGLRSVYVQEKISTGIAKLNSDYLCAMQRWAEGAVQLFWLQIFVDRTAPLLLFSVLAGIFMGTIYFCLYGPWTKALIGYNLICDREGEVTLFLGESHSFCQNLYGLFSYFLGHTIDKVIFQKAQDEYMRLVDFALTWLVACILMAIATITLAWRGTMPRIVRVFIMMENISYWLTSCSIFFWLSLTLYMVVSKDPPLMFNVTHFMLFIIAINVANHSMINVYKDMGECDEISLWRSQQAYTLAAPIYVMAIIKGTSAAMGIIFKKLDKSWWTSSEYGSEIVCAVTVWVTFIWVAFGSSLMFTLYMAGRAWLMKEMGRHIQAQCQAGALCMLSLLAITVWEPFLNLWEWDKYVNALSKSDKDSAGFVARHLASFVVWWRGKAWIMRYAIDFAMPLVILSGLLGGGINLITLATYASTVHGFRG